MMSPNIYYGRNNVVRSNFLSVLYLALALRKHPFGANFAKMVFLLEIDPISMFYHVAKYFVEILFIR